MKKYIYTSILVLLALLYALDSNKLQGEIIIKTDQLNKGTLIPLMLEVPENLEDIHNTVWTIKHQGKMDESSSFFLCGENLLDQFSEDQIKTIFGVDQIDYDRIAVLYPHKIGDFTIEVSGFYKKSKAQPITKEVITIQYNK